jgi:hypothetical protein
MADIKFYATEHSSNSPGGVLITHEQGSGLGFYGNGYGVSVPIGSTQDTTWMTNADGTATQRIRLKNTKAVDFVNKNRVSINGGPSTDTLDKIRNSDCPLNIRFENDEPVRVQNCKVRIFDRNNIANHASGVSTYLFESRNPSVDDSDGQLTLLGREGLTWYEFDPVDDDMSDMPMTSSPGPSGLNTNSNDDYTFTTGPNNLIRNGVSHSSLRHDWFLALSSQPHSIGSKVQYALLFSCEYL